METLSVNETIKVPVAVLKVGESRVVQPELEFPYGPVTFTLVEGNGPVYIHGQQMPNGYDGDVVEGAEEMDTDDEEEAVSSITFFSCYCCSLFLFQTLPINCLNFLFQLDEEDYEEESDDLPPAKKQKLSSTKSTTSNKKK